MKTLQIEIRDDLVAMLETMSAERSIGTLALASDVLSRYLERELARREPITDEIRALAASFAEEDRELAEMGMSDYAAQLAAEDRA